MSQNANLFNVVKSSKKNRKLTDVNRAMKIYFREQIIMDILSRLHVLLLLKFKCVSKFWNTLISDPYFKMMLLNRAEKDRNCQKFLVSQLCPNMDNTYLFSCSYISEFQVEDVQKLDFPLNSKPWWDPKIYCCCDDLFLIGVRNCLDRRLIILLWNPTTRESMVLPHPELPPEGLCTWGLGYDSINDDYKILKIHHEICSEILTLKSGSWRKIDNHPTGIYPDLSGMDSLAFVHGAFHWIGSSLNYHNVVSFNISNEVYGEIMLPKVFCLIANGEYVERGVSVLDGMLCGYCTSTNYMGNDTFNLWVMQNYGVKESWIPTYRLTYPVLYSAIYQNIGPKTIS